jgi:selenocysteine lyase/cysteine desulfurase
VHRSLEQNNLDSLAIFPFSIKNMHHSLVSSYLGTEKAIGVRSGHLCQFALIRSLLKISELERIKINDEVRNNNRRNLYGIVRASCGIGTTISDIEYLADSLIDLINNGTQAQYHQNSDGEFAPTNWEPDLPFLF